MLEFIEYLRDNPGINFLLMVLAFIGVFICWRRLRGLVAAKRLVATQYNTVTPEQAEKFVDSILDEEYKKKVIRELGRVRQKFGHGGLKVGHLFWVTKKIEDNLPDDAEIPAFVSDKVQVRV